MMLARESAQHNANGSQRNYLKTHNNYVFRILDTFFAICYTAFYVINDISFTLTTLKVKE